MKSPVVIVLVILYSVTLDVYAQPCSGIPLAGTIVMNPPVYCWSYSGPVTLTLVNYTNAPGISVQWESAPPNATNWMSIAGGITPTITISPITVATDYRAVVVCSNGGGTGISGIISVTPVSSPGCQDSVWPGDVNYDHITDNLDALDLAIAMGATGPVRSGATIAYQPQFSWDWTQSFTTAPIRIRFALGRL